MASVAWESVVTRNAASILVLPEREGAPVREATELKDFQTFPVANLLWICYHSKVCLGWIL